MAAGHGSTFDGSTKTNGYHPLFFLVLVGIARLSSGLPDVFRWLYGIDVVSGVVSFILARNFLSRRGVNAWVANAWGVLFFCFDIRLISQQMEVTLTVPLGLLLLTLCDECPERYTPRKLTLIGFIMALMILSRLDSGILAGLLCLAAATQKEYRRVFRGVQLAAFAAASGIPLLAYLALNEHFFHRLLPISGVAKQLKGSLWPSSLALRSWHGLNGLILAFAVFCLIAYLILIRRRTTLSPVDRVLLPVLLAFPALHLLVLSVLSDWKLWGWYNYSLRFGILGIVLFLVFVVPETRKKQSYLLGPLTLLLSFLVLALSFYHIDPEMVGIANAAERLAKFEDTHPGRYAMGDRAGMFGYLSPGVVIQMEGLMRNSACLDHIRHEQPLRALLRDYRADYYVTFVRSRPGACLEASEPAQAGPMAPHSRGEFCEQPTAVFHDGMGYTIVYAVK